MPRRANGKLLQHGDPPQAGVGVGNQGLPGDALAVGRVHGQRAGYPLLQPTAMINFQGGLQGRRAGPEGPADGRQQARRQRAGKPLPVDDAQGIEPCGGDYRPAHEKRYEPAPAQQAQKPLEDQAALDAPDFFEKIVHGTLRK